MSEAAAGQRLDNYLLGALKGVPRSHIYRLIRSGQVRVNSGRVTPKHRLKAGDRVRVPPVATRVPTPVPASGGSLDWLAERIVLRGLAVARARQAGWARGARRHGRRARLHRGAARASAGAAGARARAPAGPRDLGLPARREAPQRARARCTRCCARAGSTSAISRSCKGAGPSRTPRSRRRSSRSGAPASPGSASRPAARPPRATFRLIDTLGRTASLLEVAIATGRTHQIRVHAAHAGHPVAGDDRYGDPEFNDAMRRFGLRRMFLHSRSIAFVWPESGEEFSVDVPLPPELSAVLTALAEGKRGRADRAPRA